MGTLWILIRIKIRIKRLESIETEPGPEPHKIKGPFLWAFYFVKAKTYFALIFNWVFLSLSILGSLIVNSP